LDFDAARQVGGRHIRRLAPRLRLAGNSGGLPLPPMRPARARETRPGARIDL